MAKFLLRSHFLSKWDSQKQPQRGVLRKRCSEKVQEIYRRKPMLKCSFNKVAKQLYWNHTSAWVFYSKLVAYFQNTFFLRTPLGDNFWTVKQQVSHGTIQNVCHLHNRIFHSIIQPISHFVKFSLTPLFHLLETTNYGIREKKIFCIYGCFSKSRYIKEIRKLHL